MKNTYKFMPMYWEDYALDTEHLSTVEHGAYLLLLSYYWRTGKPLPDSDVRLSRIAKMDDDGWLKIKPTIAEFFQRDGGVWRNKRVEQELEVAAAISSKKRDAAQKRWRRDPLDHVVIPMRRAEPDDVF